MFEIPLNKANEFHFGGEHTMIIPKWLYNVGNSLSGNRHGSIMKRTHVLINDKVA